eukprot:GILK01006783.1.p1 GENE.GILK01006783.1~~GILK01006783.1.p1  ORF type:complete len:750 (-),score=105.49 GILK01006783.1:60-2240(-)
MAEVLDAAPRRKLLLSPSEEKRLEGLFHSFVTSGLVSLRDFCRFVRDRRLLDNCITLPIIHEVFKDVAGDVRSALNKEKFFAAISVLTTYAVQLFDYPSDYILERILKQEEEQVEFEGARLHDAHFDILATVDAVKTMSRYYEALQEGFLAYTVDLPVNERHGLQWRDAEDHKLTILARNMLRFCRASSLMPHMISVESFIHLLLAVSTPRSPEEKEFYDSNILVQDYEEQLNTDNMQVVDTPLVGEPRLNFSEFVNFLGRIAITYYHDEPTVEMKLLALLDDKLALPQNGYREHSNTNRWSAIDALAEQQTQSHNGHTGYDYEDEADYYEDASDRYGSGSSPNMSPRRSDWADELENVVDLAVIIRQLELELPPIPSIPQPPPPPPPPAPPKVNLKAKPGARPAPRPPPKKKGPPPPKPHPPVLTTTPPLPIPPPVVGFVPPPSRPVSAPPGPSGSRQNMFSTYQTRLQQEVRPETAKTVFVNPDIKPTVIREILYPPPAPQQIAMLLESALMYQNTSRYASSIQSYKDAWAAWKDVGQPLRLEVDLFFMCSLAAVQESAGADDLAMNGYLEARRCADKLPYNHPDKAFPYCGLGSVFYHLGDCQTALRCYLKAKEIREFTLGGSAVDTATVYHNLAVCMHGLDRIREACAFYQLSKEIFEIELGRQHPRFLTASRNIHSVKRRALQLQPEFKPLWKLQVKDKFPPVKAKKKGKKGKKGGKKGKK